MAANLSKKFSLLICCLMTMQALRLVISTAGFCAVRFHIDRDLFNIFISRLVNAVMMAQLFGNWFGDLTVFAFSGQAKLGALALANWTEFACFCFALFSICIDEEGMLTGFYWSMVLAYFWWKVGEAPAISIGSPESTDYYFAGFTLSGVWGSCLKGLVMRCVANGSKPLHFHSQALGDVNVKVVGGANVVGRRSVKTTVDYRAAKWLFIIVIVLTGLMCVDWTAITFAVITVDVLGSELKDAASNKKWDSGVWGGAQWAHSASTTGTDKHKAGKVTKGEQTALQVIAGIAFGGVLAVPGAMLGVGVGWVFALCFKCCLPTAKYASLTKWCQLIFGIVGAVGGMAAGVTPCVLSEDWSTGNTDTRGWVVPQKWCAPYAKKEVKEEKRPTGVPVDNQIDFPVNIFKEVWTPKDGGWKDVMTQLLPMIGLGVGLALGALVGRAVGECEGSKKRGTAAGAFFGSFLGLWFGEIANGGATASVQGGKGGVVFFGFLIVVLGCSTVYSVYPGMAPCSITQFKYFNIIDILILILSSIVPLVIMGLDLAVDDNRLGMTIADAFSDLGVGTAWMAIGILLLISTNVCEILVISIMQHPHSKMAQKVTTSGWRAVLLTVTMVTSQLTSTSVGFASVAAGSGFNDGVYNALSTLVLWTMECCGVLGEGYLTELKKYEPGKWPTQGMGKWESHKWWRNKSFSNAWQIWCCICTTDLRRDIMLCKQ